MGALLANQYSGKENLHLEESIDNRILDLIKLIETKYISDSSHIRPVNFARTAQFLTLDVITDVAFGEPFGDLVADEDRHEYIDTIGRLIRVLRWFIPYPGLTDLMAIPWIGRRMLPSAGDDIGVGKVMGCVSLMLPLL